MPPPTPYTPLAYLLDRANIHDTVTKMNLLVDIKSFSTIPPTVFAPTVVVDYTSIFGGAPSSLSGSELAGMWEKKLAGVRGSQHIITSLLIQLPQPGDEVAVPATAKVAANASVTLVRDTEGVVQNGGRYDIELIRTEEPDGNPWRIGYLKADKVWERGDVTEVLAATGPE